MASGFTFDKSVLEAALKRIYARNFHPMTDIEEHLFNEFWHTFNIAADEGFSKSVDPDDDFREAIRHNNAVFSAFKTHRLQNDMAARLLDENGDLKPFNQWKKDVQGIASHQCGAWLQTEYDTAVIRARQAADWKQFERERDVLPNLKWLPSTSVNPGEDHRPFWGTILPIGHPFWSQHRPGDRWNCKCDLTSTDEPPTPVPSVAVPQQPSSDPHRGLDNNPGKDAALFSDSHPYFPSDCNHCPFYKPSPKARIAYVFHAQGKKGNCTGNCPYVDNAIEKVKGKDIGIRADLEQLHDLVGADFVKKLMVITERREFKPVPSLEHVFSTGGESQEDYPRLLNGAKKAVDHGYNVFILPNPKRLKTGDYILERKGIYKLFDLKTIFGKSSAGNRLAGSKGQANRALLNMDSPYSPRKLAQDIKDYFANNPEAVEVLIFKGKREICIKRDMVDNHFIKYFMREYGK